MTKAIFFDAYGTLVHLDDFQGRMERELARRGVHVSRETVEACCLAEMGYYTEHCGEGVDMESVRDLRYRCARVLRSAFSEHAGIVGLDVQGFYEVLMQSLRFVPYPDVRPTLANLRSRQVCLAVVSNWDCELPAALVQAGIADHFDLVLASAACGCSKPEPQIFEKALTSLCLHPDEVVHVGDKWNTDVVGPRRVGIRPVLLQRDDRDLCETSVPVIRSLLELPDVTFGCKPQG